METIYKISNHVAERYAQRLRGKDEKSDINKFLLEHKEKINTDLHKMIQYGQLIYKGKESSKDGKGKVLDVYLSDTWVILVDEPAKTMVTIFKIDLGCGDEFNLQYINKMIEKIEESKSNLDTIKAEVDEETKTYREMIDENISQINEFRNMIKNLESLNEAYKSILDNNNVKLTQANRETADLVNKLVNKKTF